MARYCWSSVELAGMTCNFGAIGVFMAKKIVIVGAGISGATLAERYAVEQGAQVLVLEKRDHIGGNCYDFYNSDGILVSKYGAHLFHTNYEDVWQYVSRFSGWYAYEHRVLSKVGDKLVPVPVNMTTVNELFDLGIAKEEEMMAWLEQERRDIGNPQNSEESALSRVGPRLYELMFKHYTKKQWDMWPAELDESVMNRIPVRSNLDDRYFTDVHQALPSDGYTKLFANMLDHPNIEVRLNTDYFAVKDSLGEYDRLFYTGPVDRFFEHKHSTEQTLQYRSINFVFETHDQEFYQSNSVINYPGPEVGFTRIVEYKHFTGQKHPKTTISKEFSTWDGEPYYPVPTDANQRLYQQYQQEVEKLDNVHFVGRLANYKYFNMDQAFKNALDLYASLEPQS
jgi:UDP-galactopyranose mutase